MRRLGSNLRVWSGKGVRYPSVQAAKDAMGVDARYGVILGDTDKHLWEGAENNGWEVRRMGGASSRVLTVWSGKGVRYPSVQAAKDAMGLHTPSWRGGEVRVVCGCRVVCD